MRRCQSTPPTARSSARSTAATRCARCSTSARISSACWMSRRRWPASRRGLASSRPTPPRRSRGGARREPRAPRNSPPARAMSAIRWSALVAGLSRAAGEAGGWTHWGATTQDIMDTATVLQIRDGLALIRASLLRHGRGAGGAGGQAPPHGDGRAHASATGAADHARPEMRGLGAAADRPCRSGSTQLRPRVEQVSFGGAAGTLASLGDQGIAVMEGLATELGLAAPPAPWHVSRDGVRGNGGVARPDLRQPGEARHRHHPAGADRGRRGGGTLCRRPRFIFHHAAEAQSDRQRNTSSPPRAPCTRWCR